MSDSDDLVKQLRISLRCDAVHGDDWERSIFESQVVRAVAVLEQQQAEIARLSRECKQASDRILEQRAEIERLKARITELVEDRP